MVDMLRIIVRGMVHGFQDSVVGMLRVYSISKEADALEEQKQKTQQSPPRTVLARRRAERMKTNPNSVKKQRLGFDTILIFRSVITVSEYTWCKACVGSVQRPAFCNLHLSPT